MAEAYVWKALADGEKGQFEGGCAATDDECIRSSGTPPAQLDVPTVHVPVWSNAPVLVTVAIYGLEDF